MSSKVTYRALNGLRFFAALAILGFHAFPSAKTFGSWPAACQNLVLSGPMALGFFYLLSGFVLAHAYLHRAPLTALKRRSFWWARVARLYPVYLLAYLLFLPMAFEKYLRHPSSSNGGVHTFVAGGVLSLLAVQAWTPFSQAWNGPAWSLSVEAFFYFIFPFVMTPMLYWSRSKLVLILGLLWGTMLTFPICHEHGLLSDVLWKSWIENDPLFWTPLFLLGIALYRCSGYWSAMNARQAAWYGAAALTVLIVLCGTASSSHRELLISGGAAPVLALLILACSHATSALSLAMSTRLLFEAGAISYTTYILQSPVRHIFLLVSDRLMHAPGYLPMTLLNFGLYIVLLLGISFAVQALFEKPAQRWLLAAVSPRPAVVPSDPGIEAI